MEQQKRHIISASRRTDIPAYFGDRLISHIESGFIRVSNPFNPNQIREVSLKAEDVYMWVFWTKNCIPFGNNLKIIDKLYSSRFYILYTITGLADRTLSEQWESKIPNYRKCIEDFIGLSEKYGKERLIWRFDPIIFTDKLTGQFYYGRFCEIIESLSRHTERCIISYIDMYKKLKRRLSKIKLPYPYEIEDLEFKGFLKKLADKSEREDIELHSCCEPLFSSLEERIKIGSCIDNNLINRITGENMVFKKHKTRPECGCCKSIDIGKYRTCRADCGYCYAL